MIFSSLLFLYGFLPLCLLCYSLCGGLRAKNACLLIFSLIFYTWGEPVYILLLLSMSLINWAFALLIEGRKDAARKKRALSLAVIADIGLIVFFKYSRMLCGTVGIESALIEGLALPLGISFYTFQLLSYVTDVYRGDAHAERSYANVLLYAALYHQCVAGPIVRYKLIANELFVSRGECEAARGWLRFCVGLGKKVLIANALGAAADALLLSSSAALLRENCALASWSGLVIATLQMYFDFSGYSDMAIGLGLMIGLHYPENFDYPFVSRSASEYWRRWHITLGQWFRDYLYYPLMLGVGTRIRKRVASSHSRRTAAFAQSVFVMVTVWACTGLWHGAEWSYVLWGLYWCVFIIAEQAFLQKKLNRAGRILPHVYMIVLMIFSRVLFRFGSLDYSAAVLASMFKAPIADYKTLTLLKNNALLIAFALVACTPAVKKLALKLKARLGSTVRGAKLCAVLENGLVPAALLIFSTAALVGAEYQPFLYFRF